MSTPIVIDIEPCGQEINVDYDAAQESCIQELEAQAHLLAEEELQNQLNDLFNEFAEDYVEDCLLYTEKLNMTYELDEYHYTLYYYDQAGNLTQTVPPEGVDIVDDAHFTNGLWDGVTEPNHSLKTQYAYNSYNQVIWQTTPDGGQTQFWYNKLGQLLFSQNAKQQTTHDFSYTKYDKIGRIKEVGSLDETINLNYDGIQAEINANTLNGPVSERTHTEYGDQNSIPYVLGWQENLRGRVAVTYNTDNNDVFTTVSRYSYDEHGNVTKLTQDLTLPGTNFNEAKLIEYDYDLISGNVNKVWYQPNQPDQFIHKYEYDADNRITNVYTSQNGYLWDEEAEYFYYAHGPLARVEIGEDKVQAMDYAYTLHGWLKAVGNKDELIGTTTSLNNYNGTQEYNAMLGYYYNDYRSIHTGNMLDIDNWNRFDDKIYAKPNNVNGNPVPVPIQQKGLYNGNITYATYNIAPNAKDPQNNNLHPFEALGGGTSKRAGIYQYDQLNRIIEANNVFYNNPASNWETSGNDRFKTKYSYDGNGNILTLKRYDKNNALMDDIYYWYDYDNPVNAVAGNGADPGILHSNRLYSYTDQNDGTQGDLMLDDLPLNLAGNLTNSTNLNFEYDEIGNLVKDVNEGISQIQWTVYGKVQKIVKTDGSIIEYKYDAMGNRVMKKDIPSSGTLVKTTWYLRDASGNILAIYNKTDDTPIADTREYSIYGSSRLGTLTTPNYASYNKREVGLKAYELTNHLGNVMVVISDKRKGEDNVGNGVVDQYFADVISAQDYYPFGMQMPGRTFSSNSYRYGFNGMEKDDEVKGQGNSLDFGARIYDSRLGRWSTEDPLTAKFPWSAPYSFVANKPILFVDIDGRDIVYLAGTENTFKPIVDKIRAESVSFDNIISHLENSDNIFTIRVVNEEFWIDKEGNQIGEAEYLSQYRSIVLDRRRTSDESYESSVIEEFVHAFQFDYYSEGSHDYLEVFENYGVTFIESEAKLIRYLVREERGVTMIAYAGDDYLVSFMTEIEMGTNVQYVTFYKDEDTYKYFDSYVDEFKKAHSSDGSPYGKGINPGKEPGVFNYLQRKKDTLKNNERVSRKSTLKKGKIRKKPVYDTGKIPRKDR